MQEENGEEQTTRPQSNGDTIEDAVDGVQMTTRPSNERLLCTAFVSFMGFAIAQTFAAIIAGSEAMLGDSAAMMVDALTYLFNWYAERQKQTYANKLQENSSGKATLEYRKYTYQLELVPPLLSVFTLLLVTGFVLRKAVHVLILDAKRDISEQAKPNVEVMILFSCLNLLLDVMNVFCFAKAKHAMGYRTAVDENAIEEEDRLQVKTMRSLLDHDEVGCRHNSDDPAHTCSDYNEENVDPKQKKGDMEPMEIEDSTNHGDHHHDDESNLNMCSAYTHVFADTIRSIAVIVASVLAEFVSWITAEEADAAAAVVVSLLIVLSLIPLLGGMVQTYRSLKRVNLLLEEEDLESNSEAAYDGDEVEGNWV